MEYTIDAQNRKLGRVATEVASLLMGKNKADFARNKIPEVTVKVINASRADISSKKMDQKVYTSYSGYPGGLKQNKMRKLVHDKGLKEAFRKAIAGMLPKNKLRAKMLTNLKIEN